MRVTGFDHLVLRVADAERAVAWYREALGLEPLRLDAWRRGEVPFPSVRVDATTIIDLLPAARDGEHPDRNLDHLCLVVDADLHAAATSGAFDVVEGPATRWGAQGDGTALYVRDPDGNVVELRSYG